jgi:hypothetical protein
MTLDQIVDESLNRAARNGRDTVRNCWHGWPTTWPRDLATRFGRGFSRQNLQRFRLFYLSQPVEKICSTLSSKLPGETRATLSLASEADAISQTQPAQSQATKIRPTPSSNSQSSSAIFQTSSGKSSQPPFALADLARAFPLPWSHYVLLISRARSPEAFAFYHAEALRGGWSVRQLDRQMASLFYERAALSKNKAAVLKKGEKPQPTDAVSADEEIRDPLVLEFLNLKVLKQPKFVFPGVGFTPFS